MRLELNAKKCELIARGLSSEGLLATILRTSPRVEDHSARGATVSGSRHGQSMLRSLHRACGNCREAAVHRSQDAQILLRASFSAPKVLHLLRCSPSVSHPVL
jgi:hypothetical protein